ncbi:MerR family transcriptional regulator [Microbacterium paraoxydans]|uniref:MerR family transcriptional regulator n=1 Tax=Microbacterium paraoxydans TaxID=199592 RepID=A0ABS5IIG7_9MICO|nr:MerR family transcriptional regulator [Microbacterium paraoxydans]MBS0022760.1 MerR family transcriptional regulator [Microbacterium paraoxydans]
MRISELSAQTGVTVPTIKYYLREGLLPEGERTSATQAAYGEKHVERLRVIRALLDAGVSIAETRRVLGALDDPPGSPHELLGAAHAAITPAVEGGSVDLAEAEALVKGLGWTPGACDPAVLHAVARALDGLRRAGFVVPDELMREYLTSVRRIADAEIAGVPGESAEAAVRYVVLGSVLVEPLLLALRRVAQQVASGERFGGVGADRG